MRIKNYSRFQHFKDRSPPWVKLYRDLLDDPDWHELDDRSSKILVMLWLIASEDENKDGVLPDARKLCFRLRIKKSELDQVVTNLSHWLEHLDDGLIKSCYQDDDKQSHTPDQVDTPEERREKKSISSPSAPRVSKESVPVGTMFEDFWNAYGKKTGRKNAVTKWNKINPDNELEKAILAAATVYAAATPEPRFRKDPERWLNEKRWEDESPQVAGQTPLPDFMRGAL